jgi:16S rRNA G966 N2-methylase RsmD
MKKYDGLWELNAIQEKEIWANNLVKVSVNDITKTLPSYMKSDMIYSDPPWSLGHENSLVQKRRKEKGNEPSFNFICSLLLLSPIGIHYF